MPFYLLSIFISAIFACTLPCQTCSTSTFCLTCSGDNRTINPNTGKCLCNAGYVEISNTCQQCLSPCLQCVSLTTQCTTCVDPNMNKLNNQCICKSGYLNQANLCLKCVSTCLECDGSQFYCTTCAKNLTPQNGICVCLDFISYTYTCYCYAAQQSLSYSGGICQPSCIDNCSICNGFLTCATCYSGYYLNQNNCDKCVSNCKVCLNPLTCSQCSDTFYLNTQQTCTKCLIPCLNCTSETVCTSCISPCKSCDFNTKLCTSCTDVLMSLTSGICTCPVDTHIMYQGESYCQPCSPPCKLCINSIYQCKDCLDASTLQSNNTCKCPDGFAFVIAYLKCKPCTLPCINCVNYQYYCTSCVDSLMIISSGNCLCKNGYVNMLNVCYPCISPCKYCQTNQSFCTSCVDNNMTLNSGICKCNSNYLNKLDICYLCILPCSTCSVSTSVCDKCIDSLMNLNNGICTCPVTHVMYYNDSCFACTPPCKYCNNSITYCTDCLDISTLQSNNTCKCPDGYIFFITDLKCKPCTLPCKNCLNYQYYCTSCVDQQMYITSGSCICQDGYVNLLNVCQPCISPCKYCQTTQSFCKNCVDVNMDRNSSTGTCKCKQNYLNQLDICYECLLPCSVCSDETSLCDSCIDSTMDLLNRVCTCKPQYYELNFVCLSCVTPCVLCSSNSQCQTCIQGYAFVQSFCLTCLSPCINCFDDQNYCTTCVDQNMDLDNGICSCRQTFAQISNKCYACISPCLNCFENQNYCTSCIDAHMNIQSGKCFCDPGYYAKTVSFCDACKYPCSTCSGSDIYCNSCIADLNRTLVANKCPCDFGYYDDGICKLCIFPCKSCISEQICSSCTSLHMNPTQGICYCDQGYFLKDKECLKCDEQCLTCESTKDNCLICINSNMDLNASPKCQCKFGYYQSSPQQCTACIRPCETCYGTATFCISCVKENLVLIDNTCICLEGYAEINSKCQLCQLPCSTCAGPLTLCTKCIDPIQSLDSGTCKCPYDHYLDQNFMCQKCQLPCLTCQGSNTFCLKCNDELMELNNKNQCYCQIGYFENNGKCYKCMNGCEFCNEQTTCQLCLSNYVMNQQQSCDKCKEPCLTCEISTNKCTSCINSKLSVVNYLCSCLESQYLDDDNCNPCPNYCQSCTSAVKCTQCFDIKNIVLKDDFCQCEEGYTDNSSTCQICDSYCRTCLNEVNNCTKCFETQNRELVNNQCQCLKGYYDEGNLDCIKCSSENGIDRQECNYRNCGDGIFTWGEKCDDGNNIPRDGCTNCQIDDGYQCINQILTTSSCQTCTTYCIDCDQSLQCNQCAEGYYLLDQKCLDCQDICQSCDKFSECNSCRYLKINGKCTTCDQKKGYSLDLINQKCVSICGDGLQSDIEQCDDGNLQNGDGCDSKCLLEQGFVKAEGIIKYIQPLKPQIKEISAQQNTFKPNRTFILSYNYQLLNNINFTKYINISITNKILLTDYKITITDESTLEDKKINFTLKIELQLLSSIKSEKLKISYPKPNLFIAVNKIKQTTKEVLVEISQFQYVDQSTQENTNNIAQINQYFFYSMGALVVVGVLSGGISIFYSVLDLLQLVSYLQYINTEFPYNLDSFLNLFKFTSVTFLDQYTKIKSLYDYIDHNQLIVPPEKMASDGFSTNIILNIYPVLQVWIMFFASYLASLAFYGMSSRYQISIQYLNTDYQKKSTNYKFFIKYIIVKVSWEIKSSFFWSIFMRTIYSTSYDLCFMIMLNFYNFELYPSYYFNQAGQILSLCLFVLYMFIIYKSLGIISSQRKILVKLRTKYGAIFEGLKLNRYQKLFNTFNMLKKILMMMSLILFYEHPIFQAIFMLFLNTATVLYLLLMQPLNDMNELLKQSFSELYLFILQINIALLVVDKEIIILNYDQRSLVGWCAIFVITLMIVTQILISIAQQYKTYIKIYNKIINYFQKLKRKNFNPIIAIPNLSFK